jgi:hypothetical protein
VVNFFTDRDPLIAVGSVAATGAPARYVWRCYLGDEAAGLAPDMPFAEASLRRALAGIDQLGGNDRGGETTRRARAADHWRKLNATPFCRP